MKCTSPTKNASCYQTCGGEMERSVVPMSCSSVALCRTVPGWEKNGESPSRRRGNSAYLVISKLHPFRRSRALFRMMPGFSRPRYTFISEFMAASGGQVSVHTEEETAKRFFPEESGESRNGFTQRRKTERKSGRRANKKEE